MRKWKQEKWQIQTLTIRGYVFFSFSHFDYQNCVYCFYFLGYFSVWAMVIFAAQHSGVSHEDVRKELSSLSSLNLFAVAAIVVVVAASFEVPDSSGSVRGNTIYILVLACLTVCLVGGMFLMEHGDTPYVDQKIQFYVLSLFSIMWIVAAALVTFEGPFEVTGNGYFASWGSAIISVFAALSARQSAQARAASS